MFLRVKTRLQVQFRDGGSPQQQDILRDPRYISTLDAIKKIAEQEGLCGLYAGLGGSLIGVALTNFAYFYSYSAIRSLYLLFLDLSAPPGTAVELSLGAAAGVVAQFSTTPVSVLTTRQQTQPAYDKQGFAETLKEIIDGEDGWTGLWRGLKASLVLVINPSITYGGYQRLKFVFFPTRTTLRSWEIFGKCTMMNIYPETDVHKY